MSLIKRLTFTARVAADWPSLFWFWGNTLLFSMAIRWPYLYQRLWKQAEGQSYSINWGGRNINLVMRAQDLPIFYEIFQDEVYQLPAAIHWPVGSLILDIGSHIGLFSAYVLNRYDPAASIRAVEPSPNNFRLLEANVSHYDQVKAQQEAVVATVKGKAFLQTDRLSYNHQINTDKSGTEVETIAIASLLNHYAPSEKIFLLKMDVEGMEISLIPELLLYKNQIQYLLIEIHPPYTLEQLCADLLLKQEQVVNLQAHTYLINFTADDATRISS